MQDGAFLLYVESAVPLFALAIKVSRLTNVHKLGLGGSIMMSTAVGCVPTHD